MTPVATNAALVLFHTEELRLKAEVYVRKYDHLMLFSDRFPQGLEVLKLGLDDGNVQRWAMNGRCAANRNLRLSRTADPRPLEDCLTPTEASCIATNATSR